MLLAHVGVASVELWSGAVHPWLNLESGLVLAAGTIWVTQRARASDVQPYVTSAVALAVGVGVGCAWRAPLPTMVGLGLAVAIGVAVLLDVALVLRGRAVLTGLCALYAGALAGADAAPDVRTPWLFGAGAFAGGLVFPLVAAALLTGRTAKGVALGLRWAGGAIAVASLLVWARGLRG